MSIDIDPSKLQKYRNETSNAMFYFYKPGCPFCTQFDPIFDRLAKDMRHADISFYRMDGFKYKQKINEEIVNLLGDPEFKRGYPTLYFKKVEQHELKETVWNEKMKPRTYFNLANEMSSFFKIDDIKPVPGEFSKRFRTSRPKYEFFYKSEEPFIFTGEEEIGTIDDLEKRIKKVMYDNESTFTDNHFLATCIEDTNRKYRSPSILSLDSMELFSDEDALDFLHNFIRD